VALGDVDALDDHLLRLRERTDHEAFFAPVLAGEDDHSVSLADLHD